MTVEGGDMMDFTPDFKGIVLKAMETKNGSKSDPLVETLARLSANIATKALEEYHNQLWAELKKRKIVD